MAPSRESGFTLYELMMTLLVAGILLGVGVPNLMEFQRNGAIVAAANEIVTGTLLARSEAVKRQVPVMLCLSDDPTAPNPSCLPNAVQDSATRGFVVFADEDGDGSIDAGDQLLMQSAAPGGTIRLSANCGHVGYGPNGFTRLVGALCFPTVRTVLLCDERGRRPTSGSLSAARVVRIDRPGRGQVLSEVADVAASIGAGPLQANGTCP
jgi:type IV fimbrial biogenesis protein FimT